MSGPRLARAVAAAALAIAASGCKCASEPADELVCKGCNLVIVSLTNVRKDHVGAYGYPRPTTPNIDRFFDRGWRFEAMQVPASWTLPVSASFFSSLYPYQHGLMDRFDEKRLADPTLTLTEVLKAAGYQTAGFTGGGDYNRAFNVAQGFDEYLDEDTYHELDLAPKPSRRVMAYFPAEKLAPHAADWIERHAKDRFFLLLQGYDAHCPFTPNAEFQSRFAGGYTGGVDFEHCLWTFDRAEETLRDGERRWKVKAARPVRGGGGGPPEEELGPRDVEQMLALYDAEIAQADAAIGKFLDRARAAGLEKNTVFVFMSEHGDLFGEHGRFMRGGPVRGAFYQPVLNPPLLIKHPRAKGLVAVRGLARTVDMLPTLLAMLGLEDPAAGERQGKSLFPVLLDPERDAAPYAFSGSLFRACNNTFFRGMSMAEAARDREWKLVREQAFDPGSRAPRERTYELYRLASDPLETKDVAAENPEQVARLEKALDEALGPMRARYANPECEDITAQQPWTPSWVK